LVNSVVVAVFSVGLSILLIPTWGMVGAAVAALAAAIIVNLLRLAEVFLLFRLLPYNLGFLKPILAGLAALTVAWVIRQSFATETNLFYTLINSILLLALYAGVILALGLSQEDRVVLSRLRQRMRAVLSK